MKFEESVRTCFAKYADFNGRASLPEYWWFALFVFGVGILISFISNTLSWLFYLGVLLPSIAAATRRLHDTGRSGWWQLIALVPLIGVIVLIVFLAQRGKTETTQGSPA